MVFVRNDQVGAALAAEVQGSAGNPWPPPGTQVFGYITGVILESASPLQEWSVDADFGLPPAADGGPSGGPYPVKIASGWRAVENSNSLTKERLLDCDEFTDPPESQLDQCFLNEGLTLGVSDLEVKAPPVTTAFPGGTANLTFGLAFASSAPSVPSFVLSAGTSLPGASLSLADRVFTPGPVGAAFRSPPSSRQVVLTIPKDSRSGTYEVGFTAASASAGAVAVTASLKVIKAALRSTGKAQPTVTLTFKPDSGTKATKSISLTLKLDS